MLILGLLFVFLIPLSHATRLDCYPEPNANQNACQQRGCIWTPSDLQTEPYCYFPPGVGYAFSSTSGSTINLKKTGSFQNPWSPDYPNVQISSQYNGATLNLRITSGDRFEPNMDIPRDTSSSTDGVMFKTDISANPFTFEVVRKSNSRKLFDTSIGGFVFSDKFIQIATYLPSENLYGLGENIHQTIKHDFSQYLTWGMLARDEPPNSYGTDTKNLYGVHPFYMVVEPDGLAHGVLILNSNAQEVTTAPGPSLIYRTIGGMLDMYFFPGPTPADVIVQYQKLIGTPFLPAYWSLGYQLSRYGYKDLDDMKTRIQAVRNYNIPMDTAVIDIDYMDRYKDFTIGSQKWSGLPDYVKTMKSWGMKIILIFDPAIEADYPSFQRALDTNARFIEWERADQVMHQIQDQYPMAKDTKIMLGVVWPDKHVAFPDFLDSTNKTLAWWIQEFKTFQQQVPYDGIWIDMNEPSNYGTNDPNPWYYQSADHPDDLPLFCPMDESSPDAVWDMPPYKTHNVWNFQGNNYLATKTLCLLATQDNGKQRFYNVKNLYGLSETKATLQALYQATGKRGAVISRSTFPSSGHYAGHWLGDNTARWEDLRTSVIGAQEFNLFGIPYVGSDVCGFINPTTEELCLRWQQMGAFHSFFRNHNDIASPPQDPAMWPSVAAATRKANLFRYKYLPYLFTLHHLATQYGGTVIRPMFFEYPHDSETYNLGYQYMWGPSILVAPVLTQGANSVSLYLPEGKYYSLFDYNYGQNFEAGMVTVPAPQTSQIPTFVRAGYIIPRQTPNVTTQASRSQAFEVLIVPDNQNSAQGTLRWDDGDTITTDPLYQYWDIDYKFLLYGTSANLTYHPIIKASRIPLPTLDIIEIFNYPAQPDFTSFKLNGVKINVNVQQSNYSPITKILTISTTNFIKLSYDTLYLTWNNAASKVKLDLDKPNDLRGFYSVN